MDTIYIEKRTSDWYKEYYKEKGKDRSDLFKYSEVLSLTLAYDGSVISALASTKVERNTAKILDVGCGRGGSLVNFIKLGFMPENITTIDIQEEMIQKAKKLFPNVNFVHRNAANMEFSDLAFDVLTESTMFVQLTDDEISRSIANETIRVTKTVGYIILVNWRYSIP